MNDSFAGNSGIKMFTNVFSAAGIGLLVGIIVGMSVSPVVSIILGGLTSLLAALLGLQDSGSATDALEKSFLRLQINSIRIGSFGFACVFGIFLGLFIRTHEVFSMPVEKQISNWTRAGYSDVEARQLVVYQKLGIKPENRDVMTAETQKGQSSSLFSSLSEIDLCSQIAMSRFDNDIEKTLKAYRRQDNAKLTALADQIEGLPKDFQPQILRAVEEVLCELQK